ncbi:carbohydrate ABC transporter permease [Kocuria sp.]|uniref:carbohydrate ABC transporter permease n=1 Tax=Kocuria sp. TaxID=1871328 RepID=UPI0026DC4A3F|nr:sugar ABC transporter permease [Kocuria sp.]MDO4918938.1 sugar ABC transporter permease [Kocuria sp.]
MRRREFYSLVAPSMLVMVGLLLVPLYLTVKWSFQDVDYGSPGTFVGLDNYVRAFGDPRFGHALLFTAGLTVVVTAVLLVGGYVLASMVNRLGRMRPVVLGVLLISYVIPQVVGATMFSWLFNENFGGIVNLLTGWATGQDVLWFVDAWPNRIMVALNVIWSMLPFATLIILAGLQGVSRDVLEAAQLDGAGRLRMHWSIILPSIRGVIGFVGLISVMDILRVFDNLVPLSPQAVELGNESLMLYIFNIAFQDGGQDLGMGSALSVLTIAVIVVMLYPFLRDVVREARQS